MKRTRIFRDWLCLLSFLALSNKLFSQNLIPWLGKNGKYGYADESGKIIAPPVLDEAVSFLSEMLAVDSKKNGLPVSVLRNGAVVSIPECCAQALPVRRYLTDGITTSDSISHLLALKYGGNKMKLLDLRANPPREVQSLGAVLVPDWFERVEYSHIRYLHNDCKFILGSFKIYKDKDRINFVDTDLKEIFPRDFVQGAVADEQYFILAEGNGRFAIGDRSGKIRTPFAWKSLLPAGEEGYFIVNQFPYGLQDRAGVIDADGKLVIDTAYTTISKLKGSKLLILTKGQYGDQKSWLMDCVGRSVLPKEVSSIRPVPDGSMLVLNDGYEKANIINPKGEKLLVEDAISIGEYDEGVPPHFIVTYADRIEVIDTNMQLMFRESRDYEINAMEDNLYHFRLKKKIGEKHLYGVKDKKGNWVLEPKNYDYLDYDKPNRTYYVKKDSMVGRFDQTGNEIIPLRHQEIKFVRFIHDQPDSLHIWVKEKGKVKWSAYDLKGRKLDFPDEFDPCSQSVNQGVVGFERTGTGLTAINVVLEDGTRIPFPNPSGEMLFINGEQHRTPEGGFVIFGETRLTRAKDIKVHDQHFKNILPPGFGVLSEHWKESSPEHSGLLAVYSNNGSQCGVINALGEWVLQPKTGVRFKPNSYYLVAEVPFAEKPTSRISTKPYYLHRVNQGERSSIQINSYPHMFIEERPRRFVQSDNAAGTVRFILVDKKGRELVPYSLISAPESMYSNHALLTYINEKKEVQQIILDREGNIVHRLGNLFSADFWCEESYRPAWSHIVVQNKVPLPPAYLNPAVKTYSSYLAEELDKQNPTEGIMDSTGQLVVPLAYKKLKIILPGRVFSAMSNDGKTQLHDWKTDLISTFSTTKPLKHFQLGDGSLLVGDESKTVLLSPVNKLHKEYNAGLDLISDFDKLNDFNQQYFISKNAAGNNFWVRIADGKILAHVPIALNNENYRSLKARGLGGGAAAPNSPSLFAAAGGGGEKEEAAGGCCAAPKPPCFIPFSRMGT